MPHRDQTVDGLRGVAILAVVVHHSLLAAALTLAASPGSVAWPLVSLGLPKGGWVPIAAYSGIALNVVAGFHMPLFAFLSGWTLKPASLASHRFLIVRFRRLMVPYVAWLAIYAAVASPSPAAWLAAVGRGLLNHHAPGTLWFLYALFLSLCVLWVLSLVPVRRSAVLAGAALIAIGLAMYPTLPVLRYLNDVLWLFPFLVAGNLLAGHPQAWRRMTRPAGVVAAALAYAAGLWLSWPGVLPSLNAWYEGAAGLPGRTAYALCHYGAGLAMVVVLWPAVAALAERLRAPLAGLGRRTLGLYAAHSIFLGLFVSLHAGVVVIFAGSLACSVATVMALERVPVARAALLGLYTAPLTPVPTVDVLVEPPEEEPAKAG